MVYAVPLSLRGSALPEPGEPGEALIENGAMFLDAPDEPAGAG